MVMNVVVFLYRIFIYMLFGDKAASLYKRQSSKEVVDECNYT